MISQLDIWFLAIALGMDCFAVSTTCGIIIKQFVWPITLRMAMLFGLFQLLMPLAGWLGISLFAHYLEEVDHWIAFGLLAFLGGRMIRDAFLPALAIGISFACMGFRHIATLAYPLFVIGLAAFMLSVAGMYLGTRFGKPIERRLKPELLGGLILIAIGIKVLVSHLCE